LGRSSAPAGCWGAVLRSFFHLLPPRSRTSAILRNSDTERGASFSPHRVKARRCRHANRVRRHAPGLITRLVWLRLSWMALLDGLDGRWWLCVGRMLRADKLGERVQRIQWRSFDRFRSEQPVDHRRGLVEANHSPLPLRLDTNQLVQFVLARATVDLSLGSPDLGTGIGVPAVVSTHDILLPGDGLIAHRRRGMAAGWDASRTNHRRRETPLGQNSGLRSPCLERENLSQPHGSHGVVAVRRTRRTLGQALSRGGWFFFFRSEVFSTPRNRTTRATGRQKKRPRWFLA
jgi:hypothetical protein